MLADEGVQDVGGSGEEAGREESGGTVGLGGASADAGSDGLGGRGGMGSTGGFASGGQAGAGQAPLPLVVAIAIGIRHSCALLDTGAVRCWGQASNGALGYATRNAIGDDEFPSSAGDVDAGGRVIQIAAGSDHTCALLDGGRVRCWGASNFGQLGYANTRSIGDDESPSAAGDVDVGGEVVQVAAGGWHTCALLRTGAVRCWGLGKSGALGYGNKDIVGDDETPARAGDVDVGGPVELLALGFSHTCALLRTGDVRCWGTAYVPGQLGFPNQDIVGDDETPTSVGTVDVGGPVIALSAGIAHTCAVLENGALRCWGDGSLGVLGYGNSEIVGDNETPRAAGDVNIGGAVAHIGCGSDHSCAVLRTGEMRCWGNGVTGALGYGNTEGIGDDEPPASAGDVRVGGAVLDVAAGDLHTCALLATGGVRCWGSGIYGALGYGNTNDIGDNEVPASVGDVPVL